MKANSPKVAAVGCGYWGKNLVRNFEQLGALACVCDTREDLLRKMQSEHGVRVTQSFEAVLKDQTIDAVAIAVPAVLHYELAKKALLHGKDVFVEKPLALRSAEGRDLVELAARHDRILMVGHILQYHPAILELKRLIQAGDLGKIQYVYSSRLNLGKLRTEENILWSFAPHDISAILFLLDESPSRVAAQGGSYVNTRIFDMTLTTVDFPSGVKAHIFVSWLHPFKEQKLTIVADRMMAVFDDTEAVRKLVLYAHRIDWPGRVPVAHKDGGQVVPLPEGEPLRAECQHFLDSVRTHSRPRTDGESALRVLQVLESCEESLQRGGRPVETAHNVPVFSAHPTAVIDEPCQIGQGTKIWHFSHIMAGVTIGRGCNLGQNVLVAPGVKIGENVKIQNNVSVYTGVELEDDVFCGPSMVFTNVINPRSHIVRKEEYRKTLVKRGATIGANATVVCGTTIGRYAFVGVGAVVTRDVPDYGLVVGVPARQVGWMCYCGTRLPQSEPRLTCPACGRQYSIEAGACVEIPALPPPPELRMHAVAG